MSYPRRGYYVVNEEHHNRGLTSAIEVHGRGPVYRACVTYPLTRAKTLPELTAQLSSLPPTLPFHLTM